MYLIPDHPIIRCTEATGYPPKERYSYWAFDMEEEKFSGQDCPDNEDDEEEEDDDD